MELELISFTTCPYVQRSRITMLKKGVEHKVTYIDLADPPAWFTKISPLGKVPLLRVTDNGKEDILFESAVINEFVDEVSADKGRLMPADAIERAHTRAWIEYGSNCLVDFYHASMAKDEATHMEHLEALNAKLVRLDEKVVGPFFFGDSFTLADAALAPLVMRLSWFEKHSTFDLGAFPTLAAWRDALLKLDAVKDSIVSDWEAHQTGYAIQYDAFIGARIQESGAVVAPAAA